jgi:hypothetical protein
MTDTNSQSTTDVIPEGTTPPPPPPKPDNASHLTRRATLAALPREARTTIAFLDAEEQMLELRLSRRRGGDPRYPQEARRELNERRDLIVKTYERIAEKVGSHRHGTRPNHRYGN